MQYIQLQSVEDTFRIEVNGVLVDFIFKILKYESLTHQFTGKTRSSVRLYPDNQMQNELEDTLEKSSVLIHRDINGLESRFDIERILSYNTTIVIWLEEIKIKTNFEVKQMTFEEFFGRDET